MRITVRTYFGQTYTVDEIDPHAPVTDTKAKLGVQLSLAPQLLRLIHAGRELLDDDVIDDESIVYLVVPPIRINVRSVSGDNYTVDDIDPGAEVAVIKAKLSLQLSIEPHLQRLIYAGRELLDTDVISSLGLKDESIVHLVVRQPSPDQIQDDFVAIPVPDGVDTRNMNVDILLASLTREGYATLQLSRIIKMFTIIDCIFLMLLSLGTPLVLIAIALPIAGYLGAAYFRVSGLCLYIIYILMNIAYRAFIGSSSKATPFFVVVNAFGIVLEAFIMFLTQKLIVAIRAMTPDQMGVLLAIERRR